MGQRLVLSIVKGEEKLANAYYHWSGYTGSAVHTVDELLKHPNAKKLLRRLKISNNMVQNKVDAIRLLEATGSRISPEDVDYMKDIAPHQTFEVATNRNDGLTSVTTEEMNSTDGWAEMVVDIDVMEEKVYLDVLFVYRRQELIEELDYSEEDLNELPEYTYPDPEVSIDKFNDFKDIVYNVLDQGRYMYKTPEGLIIGLIG